MAVSHTEVYVKYLKMRNCKPARVRVETRGAKTKKELLFGGRAEGKDLLLADALKDGISSEHRLRCVLSIFPAE